MIDKLEKKFGKYAIRGLMKYLIILYAAGFIINAINPDLYGTWLMLDIDKLLEGQVWRIITFIIQPVDTNNIFRILLTLYVNFLFGMMLESMWGSFRFNLYYFSGIFFNALAIVAIYIFTYCVLGSGISYPLDLTYLNLTLFLAFAVTFPEQRFGFGGNGISMFMIVYLMAVALDVAQAFAVSPYSGIVTLFTNLVWVAIFCLSPKGKYLALGYLVLIGVEVFQAFMSGWILGVIVLIAIVFSMFNFMIFFISLKKKGFAPNNPARRMFQQSMRQQAARHSAPRGDVNRGKIINIYKPSDSKTMHKCAICGRTEKDDDSLEFRFCSKCNGSYEYCSDHLYTHEHKT
ncbi:MAG: hypothetical protein K6G24_04795 [Lachnospiraceae bacterium]|nr:hypothetical protein [Lachnospiraceae bacterium]